MEEEKNRRKHQLQAIGAENRKNQWHRFNWWPSEITVTMHRFNRLLSTVAIYCVFGIQGNKVNITGLTDGLIGATTRASLREHVLEKQNSLQHRINRHLKDDPSEHSPEHHSERLFLSKKKLFSTDLTDATSVLSIGALTSTCYFVRITTTTIHTQCDRLFRHPHRLNQCSLLFCSC